MNILLTILYSLRINMVARWYTKELSYDVTVFLTLQIA